MTFGDPLLQQRNYSLPELEKEQEALQQKMADMKRIYQQPQQPVTPGMGRNRQNNRFSL